MTVALVTTVTTEVAHQSSSSARVTTVTTEVLHRSTANARVTAVTTEVLHYTNPPSTEYTSSVSGGVASTATLARKTSRRVGASLGGGAVLTRKAPARLSASSTGTALVRRRGTRRTSASTSGSATLTTRSVVQHGVSAAVSVAAAVVREAVRRVTAATSATAYLRKEGARRITSAVTSTTALLREVGRTIGAIGTTTASAVGRKRYGAVGAANVATGTQLVKRGRMGQERSIAGVGATARRRLVARSISAALAGATAVGGALRFRRSLEAGVLTGAALRTAVRRWVGAIVVILGVVSPSTDRRRQVLATLIGGARVGRRSARRAASGVAGTARGTRRPRLPLRSTLAVAAVVRLSIYVRRTLAASAFVAAALRARARRRAGAQVAMRAALQKYGKRVQRAGVSSAAHLGRRWAYRIPSAGIASSAILLGQFGRTLRATTTLTRSLLTRWVAAVTGWSQQIGAQVTLQPRYVLEASLTTPPSEVSVPTTHTVAVSIELADVVVQVDA